MAGDWLKVAFHAVKAPVEVGRHDHHFAGSIEDLVREDEGVFGREE